MAAEFIVAGRRPLPAHEGFWEVLLQNEQGAVEVYECGARYTEPQTVATEVGKVVGWKPEVVVMVRKAWELGQVVAEELATLLNGAVFCDVDDEVFFDGETPAPEARSIRALEERLRHVFTHPEPFFARWSEAQQRQSPSAEEQDFSDL